MFILDHLISRGCPVEDLGFFCLQIHQTGSYLKQLLPRSCLMELGTGVLEGRVEKLHQVMKTKAHLQETHKL